MWKREANQCKSEQCQDEPENTVVAAAALASILLATTEGLAASSSLAIDASSLTVLEAPSDAADANESVLDQVTSVSQLSDVKPTDWAFQSLQSLVERYGCIVGYPDKTFRGNRALTRYEFAAGVNACLDRVNELIAAGTANLVKKEDLVALQKMQEEFATELAVLRGRMGTLEVRRQRWRSSSFRPPPGSMS